MDKQALRERVWDDLEESGEARFPFPPHGRIPNFAGASDAAALLADQREWKRADTVKANPDAPQLPARRTALREGKTVYMAVPRLRDEQCFLELDPDVVEDPERAPTLSHVNDYARQVGPSALPHVDFVLCGSVAVSEAGARVGKGEGYSDLEFAILTDLGLVDDDTVVATTVHETQVVPPDAVTPDAHDVPMDLVATPERVFRPERTHDRPTGVDWDALPEERIEEMPVLASLRPE